MELVLKEKGNPTTFAIKGRLDTNTAPQLEAFSQELFQEGLKDFVVDMSECEYVSSAGLRVIIVMQKSVIDGGSLVFEHVVPEVMDVFTLTGFSNILTIR